MQSVGSIPIYAKFYVYVHVSCFKEMSLTKEGLESTALVNGSSHRVLLKVFSLVSSGVTVLTNNLFILAGNRWISVLLLH